MFTGIVEEIGIVRNVIDSEFGSITIDAKKVLEDVHIGDSIAVNGVCLTVTSFNSHSFTADVMGETVRRTSLSQLNKGSGVNLERAMSVNGRFGGHIVSGHIDSVGKISSMKRDGNAIWVTIDTSYDTLRYIVEKGSICIDGISLTVTNVTNVGFSVSVIPHTMNETTLLNKKVGDNVNLETDIIAKYTERLLSLKKIDENKSKIDMEFLESCGF